MIFRRCLSLELAFGVASFATAGAAPLVIKVGGDEGMGGLPMALEAVKVARAESPERPVIVELADGLYRLAEPLEMNEVHGGTKGAPVVWRAAKGARPVVSGGRTIDGFELNSQGLWEVKLEPGTRFDQLWVNGRRAIRARYPNERFFNPTAVKEEQAAEGAARQTLTVAPEHLSGIRDLSSDELHRVQLLAYHKWDNTRRFVQSIDPDDGELRVVGQPMKPWNTWDTDTGVVLENFRYALDAPGEWFLAGDGLLTYMPRPGEQVAGATAVAPVLSKLLVLRGSDGKKLSHLRFEGIHLQHTGWLAPPEGFSPEQAAASIEGAVQAEHVEQVIFENCRIEHTGGYGLWFRRGCTDNRVAGCYLRDLGAGGLRLGDMNPDGAETARNILENNIVRDGGHVFPCAVAVWIGHSGHNRVTHHEISHFPYTGISVGWIWGYDHSKAKGNIIEYNHIHHIGDGLLSDMGGIYTLGPSEGTRLRNNHIHHISSYKYGGWGLYNDEGSTGVLMENNLVHHTTTGGYHQHYGKENVVKNNIFAFARDHQIQLSRAEEHRSFAFTHNIILWDKGSLLGGGGWKGGRVEMDRNVYWFAGGAEPDFGGATLDQWRQAGRDLNSLVADPMFEDAAAGDWRLRENSPAQALGFEPFDASLAGVTGEQAWIELARESP